jgi:glycerol-3-phosphate acyltransferase PlsY
VTRFALLAAAAYVLGSIPFGLIIARAHGKNLRSIGSGNIGATNLARAVGRRWALLCFALDVAKGLVPTAAAAALYRGDPRVLNLVSALAVGSAAVVGHVLPVFAGFKGGKGVATSFGVALGFWPYYSLCAAVAFTVWVLVLLVWRYVSAASIAAAAVFPLALVTAVALSEEWRFSSLWPLVVAALAIPGIVVLRHRQNLKRLVEGTEGKVFQS